MLNIGDRVKLYNWKDAHAKATKLNVPVTSKETLFGLTKLHYENIRAKGELAVIQNHDSKILVLQGYNRAVVMLPKCCVYKIEN